MNLWNKEFKYSYPSKVGFSFFYLLLASPKVLSLGKENKNFVFYFAFHSLIRDFGCAESTSARKRK